MGGKGARDLVRIAKNPTCEALGAMIVEGVDEVAFYEKYTLTDYDGEYGARPAAFARGIKFENNLTRHHATKLKIAIARGCGVALEYFDDSHNLADRWLPRDQGDSEQMHAHRLKYTRAILADLASGRPVPTLLIQPQLRLHVGPGLDDFLYVSPDYMYLPPRARMYNVGEIKDFIARDGIADPVDMERTRLQQAVEILALRAEATPLGVGDLVTNRAGLITSTPSGLGPAALVEEDLSEEVQLVAKMPAVLSAARQRLARARQPLDSSLENIFDELNIHFQEGCVKSCIMASVCKKRKVGLVATLGDAASDLLGSDTEIDHVVEVMCGAPPRDAREGDIVARLAKAVRELGYDPAELLRRSA